MMTIRSSKPKIRSINSSSPVLEQNLLNVDLETNSDSPANQIFQNQLEQISDSNISRSQSINDQNIELARNLSNQVSQDEAMKESMKQSRKLYHQKKADLQLQIECEQPSMIPFVRYVLRKAQKYKLDVHILLECIKNSTESQLLSKYA